MQQHAAFTYYLIRKHASQMRLTDAPGKAAELRTLRIYP